MTITICPICHLDAPHHSTDRHLAHAEIERLRAEVAGADQALAVAKRALSDEREVNERLKRIEAAARSTVACADRLIAFMNRGGGGTAQERMAQVVRGLRAALSTEST